MINDSAEGIDLRRAMETDAIKAALASPVPPIDDQEEAALGEKPWKEQERRVARQLHATRNPNSADGIPRPDVENKLLAAVVKDRQNSPQWIVAALAKARMLAGPNRVGMVVATSSSTPQALVIMDLDDFVAWYVQQRAGDSLGEDPPDGSP